jgi:prolyl 4-hydroxylase
LTTLAVAKDLLQSNLPDSISRAYAATEAAIREGDPEAHALMALLRGAGVGAPQDWSAALGHLEAAAIAGSVAARGQLAVLGQAGAADDWPALCASIRAEDWTAPSHKQVLSAAPRIVAIDDFISRGVCDWIIALSRGRTAPAMVFGHDVSAAEADAGRSNSAFEFGFLDLDLVMLLVRARIAATIGFPAAAFEPTQVLHYQTGQRFARHHDYLDPSLPGHAADIALRGQRAITFLIYLNEDFDAGETHFPHVGVRRRCGSGGALYFGNVDPTGTPDRRTLHEGLAPTRGEKWLLSQWIRNRAVV